MIDCQTRRIATLPRAVFSDDDALIDHLAAHPRHAEWQPIEKDEPVFRLVCGLNLPPHSPALMELRRGIADLLVSCKREAVPQASGA